MFFATWCDVSMARSRSSSAICEDEFMYRIDEREGCRTMSSFEDIKGEVSSMFVRSQIKDVEEPTEEEVLFRPPVERVSEEREWPVWDRRARERPRGVSFRDIEEDINARVQAFTRQGRRLPSEERIVRLRVIRQEG